MLLKLIQKRLSPTSGFARKWLIKLKVYPLPNFAFLTDYYQDIYNEEMVCTQKYPLNNHFHQTLSQIYYDIKWWISHKWSAGFGWEHRDVNRCVHQICSNSFIQLSCVIFIFHSQENVNQCKFEKISALFCMRFMSPISHPRYDICQSVWLFLQRISAVLDVLFRYP